MKACDDIGNDEVHGWWWVSMSQQTMTLLQMTTL
jgi:hypothetical protein